MRRDLKTPIAPASLPVGVAIVPFTPDNAAVCRDLMSRVYACGFGDVVSFDNWWSALQADAEYDPALCFVATANDTVVAFCHCWTMPFIKDVVVEPSWQGRGLGTAVLTLALDTFAKRGASYVDLKTDADNPRAQSVYARLGFVTVERLG